MLNQGALGPVTTTKTSENKPLRGTADGGIAETGVRPLRRGLPNFTTNDSLQMPNRPLRRGENLLEIWDRSQAKQEKTSVQAKKGKGKKTPVVDMTGLLGLQKLSQWYTQIS